VSPDAILFLIRKYKLVIFKVDHAVNLFESRDSQILYANILLNIL